MMQYTLCSIMHFYHLSREEVFDLTYSVLSVLMEQSIAIQHPEALPKPQKKIKTEEELFDHLRGKYGV
jgi:hypothetical protein|uniref:Uncharacterized protein n=1 Tax=Podoviridae sp. cttxo15 TaxID=2826584 RepID=A0A8S5N2C1_9CAUD|nr:MAG TPA: hypothetical protein [Podoviridae sp. cttxo15]DAR63696.1 MAG TPA: hypothetical protein [Caudoviricetes sp.]DAW46960.1 MAG TPA: hypothetical protein [Caudoviricetes sp.]DAX62164.1 MAG TPA: hypothetical protein [Caudoviricetes sp.]DAY34045.1 MAG TPA: hypothetical protein [Caudoviricetes sp.]